MIQFLNLFLIFIIVSSIRFKYFSGSIAIITIYKNINEEKIIGVKNNIAIIISNKDKLLFSFGKSSVIGILILLELLFVFDEFVNVSL